MGEKQRLGDDLAETLHHTTPAMFMSMDSCSAEQLKDQDQTSFLIYFRFADGLQTVRQASRRDLVNSLTMEATAHTVCHLAPSPLHALSGSWQLATGYWLRNLLTALLSCHAMFQQSRGHLTIQMSKFS
ncbi:hypothetical protein E4U43_003432 [Claviceps pusilla]|uniref:Uncharacterized protein n=1 Tax=Claviceps pusilla TaxID=123648 RepID=A0A9P7N5H8_9HYPO|nr:hypothetical protein E4U43_003432 [Claviceps pusilla]